MKAQVNFSRYAVLAALAGIITFIYGCMTPQQQLMQDAAKGNSNAQATLGEACLWGYFAKVDYEQAFTWATEAEPNSNPLALFTLGYIYDKGLGTTAPNHARAIEYYKKALPGLRDMADEGDAQALFNLGIMYQYGLGVDQDYTQAYRYYRRSAARVFAPAVNNTAILFRDGLGVEKDLALAKRYFLKAAEKDYPPAQYNLAELYYSQGKFEPALKWFERAAQAQYPPAQEGLGRMYMQGKGVKTDPDKAEELFAIAAGNGCPQAQFKTARIMLSRKQQDKAEKWLLKAAERNYPQAMLYLARLYSAGQPAKALIMYDLAAKNGIANLEPAIQALDAATGIFLPVKLAWRDISRGEEFLKSDSAMPRIIRGFKAGMNSGSRQVFLKELELAPESFYLCFDWLTIDRNKLPVEWSGEIFKANQGKFSNTAAYWLSYAACAGIAGQGAPAMYAAEQLKQAAAQEQDAKIKKSLLDLSAAIKCSALIILGRDDDAYNHLFAYGRFNNSSDTVNYINHWTLPALKDRKKFSVASGLSETLLGNFDGIPEKQDIYDPETGKNTAGSAGIAAPAIKMPGLKKK